MRYRKILLVNPPHIEQSGYKPSPLGILYLASYLRNKSKDIQIKIVDGAIEGEWKIIQTITEFIPDLIGVSILTPGRHEGLSIAKKAKLIVPQVKTVFGNVHATIMWKQLMEVYKYVDYVIKGEGELTLWELVQGKAYHKIKGLVWRHKNKIICNADRNMIKNIDTIPFPAWNLVPIAKYPPRGEGVVNGIDLAKEIRFPLIFSRGCMGSCTFCSSWRIWKGYRSRTGKNVALEIASLIKRYNARHFVFQDDTLTGNRKEIMDFCRRIIKMKIKLAFYGTTRVDMVDKPMLQLMKKAGFYELSYGIETGSQSLLKSINKKTDIRIIKKAMNMTKKAGIKTCALLMYGLPGETKKDRQKTLKLISNIKPDEIGSVGAVWIFPGTALYEKAKHAHIIDDSFWLENRPYLIYRGGINGDKINKIAYILDVYSFYFQKTFLFLLLSYFTQKILRIKNKFFTF